MPKKQFINPADVRKTKELKLGSIPVNVYDKSVKEELSRFSKDDLLRIYRDMLIIREFETMLNLIKTKEEYKGIPHKHPGPAHLSIGQEAAAVGMAYKLDIDDFIFGSHRSHGEILAKGLSAIQKLDDDSLYEIMKNFFDGTNLAIVEKGHKGDMKSLARKFLIYGTLAEIFARETGINKGLGGSMHAFFTPFGIYPNNAIVGGSGDIAVGAALYKKVNRKSGIVVANIGDASLGCGPVWEGLTFASMDQYQELWEGDMKGGLPIIFNIMNNQYGMGGQTCGETMGYSIAARVGAALNRDSMHAERVDGYNPLAVIDAYERKMKILEEKKGPVFLDVLTYRFSGHSPSDSSSYRSKEEIEAWESVDSIVSYGLELISSGVADQATLDQIKAETDELLLGSFKLSINDDISPRMNLVANPELIGEMMFSNESVDAMEEGPMDTLLTMEENPRVKQIARKERYAYDENGNKTLDISYLWSTTTNDWIGTSKYEYACDKHGNNTSVTIYDWNTTHGWIEFQRTESAFDENGNEILNIFYKWANDWVKIWKYESAYDESGFMTVSTRFDWNATTNDWIEIRKTESACDEKGNMTIDVGFKWDLTIKDWAEDWKSKTESVYDEKGHMTLDVSYLWDYTANDWIGCGKTEFSYDETDNQILRITYDWNTTTNDWIGRYKVTKFYSYHFQSTPITNFFENASLLQIYPTLFDYGVNIELVNTVQQVSFKMIDLHGRLIFEKQISESQFLSFPYLSSGAYFYLVQQGNIVQTGKLIKK